MENKKELSLEEIESCIKTLQLLSDDGSQMAKLSEDQFIHLMKITGQLSRPDRSEKKKRNKAFNKQKAQETKTPAKMKFRRRPQCQFPFRNICILGLGSILEKTA